MRAPSRDDTTLVYSTGQTSARDRLAVRRDAREREQQPSRLDGTIRIWLERKGRNGKPVSIIRGLTLQKEALGELASRLKHVCGTGGSAKDGEIIIQGDHRARIAAELERDGLHVKLAGG